MYEYWLLRTGQAIEERRAQLANQRLTSVPRWLKKTVALFSLDLSGNRLTVLPDWLRKLPRLEYLNVSNNRLTSIPRSLGRSRRLIELDLSSNLLTSVPESLGNLTRLETLDLRGNRLTWIPQQLADRAEDGLRLILPDNGPDLPVVTPPDTWNGKSLDRAWARLRPLFVPSVSLDAILGAARMNDPEAAVLQLYTWERDRLLTLAKGTAGAAITVLTGLIAAAVEGKVAASTIVLSLAGSLVAALLCWGGFLLTGLRRLAEEYTTIMAALG